MSTQFPSVWMTPLLILSFGKEQNLPLTLKPSKKRESSNAKHLKGGKGSQAARSADLGG
jgi:hypothetical protein